MGQEKPMKKIAHINKQAEKEFMRLPEDEREAFKFSLTQVQKGKKPALEIDHLNTIGKGVVELKINGSPAYRCIYYAKHKDVVVVLGSFTKTTNGVDKRIIDTCKRRYKQMLKEIQ